MNINNDNKNILMLKELLNSSIEFDFITDYNGDNILKIKGYYNLDKVVYINFTELLPLLECYSGIDRILTDKIESEEKR